MSHARAQTKDAIERSVGFLTLAQLPYGEFPSHRFADPLLKTTKQFDSSPFTTCFVLHALRFVSDSNVEPLITNGISFFQEECEEPGIWRYWSTRNAHRIDPDLDDTCCISAELKWHRPDLEITSNEQTILANRNKAGLFKTWIREPEAVNDIDSVVNANVLLYLGARSETIEACSFLNRLIIENQENKSYWYYLDNLALYYMLSRAYFNDVRLLERSIGGIVQKTLARQEPDGSFGGDMNTGLAVCTLLNCASANKAVEKGIAYLLQAQIADGSWRPSAFYAGPPPPTSHNVWWGSHELTTAFCLEALARSLTL
jgi:hypothetical protein